MYMPFSSADYEGRHHASASVVPRTVPPGNMRRGVVAYHGKGRAPRAVGPVDIKVYAAPAGIGVNPNVLEVFNQCSRGPTDVHGAAAALHL